MSDDFNSEIDSLSNAAIAAEASTQKPKSTLSDEVQLLLKQERSTYFWRFLAITFMGLFLGLALYFGLKPQPLPVITQVVSTPVVQYITVEKNSPVEKITPIKKSTPVKEKSVKAVVSQEELDRRYVDPSRYQINNNDDDRRYDSYSDEYDDDSEDYYSDGHSNPNLPQVTFCYFDALGANSRLHRYLKGYATAAIEIGLNLTLKPYIDERVAFEDFKAGLCDMVSLSGGRARAFNAFTGSMGSYGAVPTYSVLNNVIRTLSSPKAAKYMMRGEYEIISMIPAGVVYPFVNDRHLNAFNLFADKRIAVLEYLPEQWIFAKYFGMAPIPSAHGSIQSKFNNGSVDIVTVPVIQFKPFELYKGLEPNGGIVKFPLMMSTTQIVARMYGLPEGFGQFSREYSASKLKEIIEELQALESSIPKRYWIEMEVDEVEKTHEILRQLRISLRDDGVLDGKMLTLMRKIRCSANPEKEECSAEDKE